MSNKLCTSTQFVNPDCTGGVFISRRPNDNGTSHVQFPKVPNTISKKVISHGSKFNAISVSTHLETSYVGAVIIMRLFPCYYVIQTNQYLAKEVGVPK